jgi:hypothetical protein
MGVVVNNQQPADTAIQHGLCGALDTVSGADGRELRCHHVLGSHLPLQIGSMETIWAI